MNCRELKTSTIRDNWPSVVGVGKWQYALLLCLLCLILGSCTNSSLVLRPLYNALDNQIEDRMLAYASFSDAQISEIKGLVDHYHVWHRQVELPAYVLLLRDVSEYLADDREIGKEQVDRWSRQLEQFGSRLGMCNPLYSAAPLLAGLSDGRVDEIKRNREDQRQERRIERRAERSEQKSPEERADEQIKRIRRYIELAGLKLTQSQVQDLKATMLQRKSSQGSFGDLISELDEGFFQLLESRKQENWGNRLTAYVDQRRETMAAWNPDTRLQNRQRWEAYALRTLKGLSQQQREFLTKWTAGLANSLRKLAADEPSYTQAKAIDYRCMGKPLQRG